MKESEPVRAIAPDEQEYRAWYSDSACVSSFGPAGVPTGFASPLAFTGVSAPIGFAQAPSEGARCGSV